MAVVSITALMRIVCSALNTTLFVLIAMDKNFRENLKIETFRNLDLDERNAVIFTGEVFPPRTQFPQMRNVPRFWVCTLLFRCCYPMGFWEVWLKPNGTIMNSRIKQSQIFVLPHFDSDLLGYLQMQCHLLKLTLWQSWEDFRLEIKQPPKIFAR